MLHRYWFDLDVKIADRPPMGTLLGCGITFNSLGEAILILNTIVFKKRNPPRILRIVTDVDLSDLDCNHVVPNIGNPNLSGAWYPIEYRQNEFAIVLQYHLTA